MPSALRAYGDGGLFLRSVKALRGFTPAWTNHTKLLCVSMGRRNKNKNLLAAGVAAAAPIVTDVVVKEGRKMINRIKQRRAQKRANGELPMQKMRKRRAERAMRRAGMTSTSQANATGGSITSVSGDMMIPRPISYANKRGKWMSGTNGPRICKSEFVGMVTGSVTFATTTFPGYSDGRLILNPGLENTFPWLSAIAANFESYKFHSIGLRYVPTTNLNATGNVYIVPVIDPIQSTPAASREIFSEFMDVVDTNVKLPAYCPFPLGRKTEPYRWRYVRYDPSDTTDQVTKDLGFFMIGRGGCADTTDQGELWIEYDVELFNPRFRTYATRVEGGKITGGATFSAANILGTGATADAQAIGLSVSSGAVTLFNSAYWMFLLVTATATAPYTFNVSAGSLTTTQISQLFDASGNVWTLYYAFSTGTTTFTIQSGVASTASSLYVATIPQSSLSSLPPKPSIDSILEEMRSELDSLKLAKFGRFIELNK